MFHHALQGSQARVTAKNTGEEKEGRNSGLFGGWKKNHHFVWVTHTEQKSGSFRQHIEIKMIRVYESDPAFDFGAFIRQEGGADLSLLNLLIELKEGDEPALAIDQVIREISHQNQT
jgi:hypothetical protein